jgi:hypothetical protein
MAELMLEPSWWADSDAVEERRAVIEAFQVEDLEAATADLRARCAVLERQRSNGQVITVGEVAEVVLGQWSVGFQAMLADCQRAFYTSTDHARLARAAEDARAAAVAVRDRYLAAHRISRQSLQQALNLANADACALELDRADARRLRPPSAPQLSKPAETALAAHEVVSRWRRQSAEHGDASEAGLGRLAADRVADLIRQLPAGERAVVRARIAAAERTQAGEVQPEDRDAGRVITADRLRQMFAEVAVVHRDRADGRGMPM